MRVEIGPHGMLTSVLTSARPRGKDPGLANKLELFEDRPVSWDAWDIDIFFEDRGEIVTA
jgi:alpha-mannosidase